MSTTWQRRKRSTRSKIIMTITGVSVLIGGLEKSAPDIIPGRFGLLTVLMCDALVLVVNIWWVS